MKARFGSLAGVLAALLAGCGYQAEYARAAPERFSVVVTEAKNADAIAADEVASGVRDELARRGALTGARYPRIEVEVLRQDERSESIARFAGPGGAVPEARSLTVGLVARGWIRMHAGDDPLRDTGDLRASDLRAVDRDPGGAANLRADALHDEDARSAVARRLGERMARRILGDPVAPDEE